MEPVRTFWYSTVNIFGKSRAEYLQVKTPRLLNHPWVNDTFLHTPDFPHRPDPHSELDAGTSMSFFEPLFGELQGAYTGAG